MCGSARQSVWLVRRILFSILLALLCRESEIPCAVRFDIAVTQAVERQPRQGEFLSERSEDRFPVRLIGLPCSQTVEALKDFSKKHFIHMLYTDFVINWG